MAAVIPFYRSFWVRENRDLEIITGEGTEQLPACYFISHGLSVLARNSKYVVGTDGIVHRMPLDYILKEGEQPFRPRPLDIFYVKPRK